MPVPLFHRLVIYFCLGGFVMIAVPLNPVSFGTLPLAILIGLVVVAVTGPFERWLQNEESRLLADVATRLRNPFFRLPIPGGLALDTVLRETTDLAESFANELVPADGETIRREAYLRLGQSRPGLFHHAIRDYALCQLTAGAVVAGLIVLGSRIAVTHEWYSVFFFAGGLGIVSWFRWIEFDDTPRRFVLTNMVAVVLFLFCAHRGEAVLEVGILAAMPMLLQQTYAAWWASRRSVYRHAAASVERTPMPVRAPEPEPYPPEPEEPVEPAPPPRARVAATDGWILRKGTGKFHPRMCKTVENAKRDYKRVARTDVPKAGVCLRCQAE